MQHRLRYLLSLLVLAGCAEDQPPTAPAESGDRAESHIPGHRVVNSPADPGNGVCNAAQCTLREAINAPGSTRITFAPGLTGPITLARSGIGGGTLVIEKALTIVGPGTGIIIRRRSTDPAFRIFRIGGGVSVTLRNLTVRNGRTDDRGGGIINFGSLVLTNTRIVGNSAGFNGGGIDNHGALTLTDSRVSGNSASNRGGGIFNCGQCTLTVTGSVVEGNLDDGITNFGGTFALTNSTVAHNSQGGVTAIRGRSTLTRVRIVGNSGRGGIFAAGEGTRVTLTHSTIVGNSAVSDGGGIGNREGATFTISKSTIVGNSASRGGGIANVALGRGILSVTLTLTNSTVSGNSATSGGGIFNRGRSIDEAPAFLTLRNSTVAHNSATESGGAINTGASFVPLTLINSLLAQNSAPTGPDVRNALPEVPVSARFSLIGDGGGSGVSDGVDGNQVGSASAPIDPMLGPLAGNGGPTGTHALRSGSPAIDAASAPDCPATDQRGVPRPQGPACDIGSFERAAP